MPSKGPTKERWDAALGRGRDIGKRMYLREDFAVLPGILADLDQVYTVEVARALNKEWMAAGTSSTSALTTYYSGGGMQLDTAGATADQQGIIPRTDAKASAWDDTTWPFEDTLSFECELRSLGSVADVIITLGWKLTIDADDETDADQAVFQFDAGENGNRWWCIDSVGGTDIKTDSGSVVVAANTVYKFRVDVGADRRPSFYINDSRVHASPTQLTASLTTVKPVIVIEDTSSGATKSLVVRWLECSKLYS